MCKTRCARATVDVQDSMCTRQFSPAITLSHRPNPRHVFHFAASNTQNVTQSPSVSSGLLLRNVGEQCEMVLVLRGTATDYEWMKDFTTGLSPLPHDSSLLVHSGFLELLAPIWPVIEGRIVGVYEMYGCGTEDGVRPHLMVTGHSLGGGMATVAALGLGLVFEGRVDLDLVTFAPARALNEDAAAKLEELVNVRTWVVELDAVPNLPCANQHGLPRCDSRRNYGNFGEGRDSYADHVNTISIGYEILETLNPKFAESTWGSIGVKLNPLSVDLSQLKIPGPLQFNANHICAYACYLSANYCVADIDTAWMCSECSFY